MTELDVFSPPAWRHLAFALLHTLWQGGLLALLLALVLRRLPARRQELRYAVALSAQFGVLLAGLTTWAVLDYVPPRPAQAASVSLEKSSTPLASGWSTLAPEEEQGVVRSAGGGSRWVSFVVAGWLAGVVVMLTHTAGSVLGAFRLTRGPRVEDREILDAVERLRRELQVVHRVRVVAAEGCPSPAVFGLFWPTLVLPVTMLTGLPSDLLRAILAHELAHIRRHDYVLNLGQMLVEALLFFNPAVWWLGRQARLEREACCDALAVRLTGQPLEYSRLLADWAERLRPRAPWPAAALAWNGERRPSLLLERILRVLRPGDRPGARISWAGLILLLLLGPLVVAGLWRGAKVTVALAAQVLSPAERMEKLRLAQAEYNPPTPGPGKTITLKGSLHAPDGTLITKPVSASLLTVSGNGSYLKGLNAFTGTFSVETPADGVSWLTLEPDDYAPVILGPFRPKAGGTVEPIDVVFEPGFSARVRVIDSKGKPVAGAVVNGGPNVSGSSLWRSGSGWVTDEDGIALIPHAARRPYGLSVKAAGFLPSPSLERTPAPDALVEVAIARARLTRGRVETPAGVPIKGAKLRPIYKRMPNMSYSYASSEPVMAITDEGGRFTLDALELNATYTLLIETNTEGRRIVGGVRDGQEGLRWTVGPNRTITGTVKGSLALLDKDGGKPVIRVVQGRSADPDVSSGWSPLQSTVPVDDQGRFTLSGVLPGEVVLKAGKHVVRIDDQHPQTPVTINLSAPQPELSMRRVVLRIRTAEGALEPTGAIQVYAIAPDDGFPNVDHAFPIDHGEVTFDAPVPCTVSYQARSVIGYWFKDGYFTLEPGKEPFVVPIQGVPAGAIVGQVLGPDDAPAVEGISLGVSTVEKPAVLPMESITLNNVHPDAQGRFFLSPLPIGGTYVVVAAHGHNKQVSVPVRLDGTKATERVVLRMARPVAAEGRVVGPDGKPVEGVPVMLALEHPQAGTRWISALPTDGEGRFRFNDLSPELGEYRVVLDLREGYQPTEARLNRADQSVEIRLERGHVLEGRILDAQTGWPMPGVEIYASPRQRVSTERFAYEAERKTDQQGRFRFSNLPAGQFTLNDRDGLRWQSPDKMESFTTDQAGSIELRVTRPEWSKLKPVSPVVP